MNIFYALTVKGNLISIKPVRLGNLNFGGIIFYFISKGRKIISALRVMILYRILNQRRYHFLKNG